MAVIALLAPITAYAGPWADPGDIGLRHDLQLLGDAGVTPVPLTTWPLSFPDLSEHLLDPDPDLDIDPSVRAALDRVQKRLRRESRRGLSAPWVRVAAADNPVQLRTFENTPREEGEVEAGLAWLGERFAARLQVTAVASPDDSRNPRLDGSYAGVVLGNWTFSLASMPRWWGPGWEGSLILSTNARPVPAIAVERNYSTPFETRWLSWIGPWKFTAFIGKLEGDRHISDAKLVGARVTFKPLEKLEIGLSRTAQWGGDDRPQDLESFIDLVAGTKDNLVANDDEPGNQLGGYDFRWRSPLFDLPYAVYGQLIGEDESGGLPSKMIGLGGLEFWGGTSFLRGSYRIHLEYSDTAVRFYESEPDFNVAYNHSIYQDGYRYYDRSIGHSIDNDGRIWTVGATLVQDDGVVWNALLRKVDLNRDGGGLNTVSREAREVFGIHLSNRREALGGLVTLALGAERSEPENDDASWDSQAYVQWQSTW